jgi:hypothetical protein
MRLAASVAWVDLRLDGTPPTRFGEPAAAVEQAEAFRGYEPGHLAEKVAVREDGYGQPS